MYDPVGMTPPITARTRPALRLPELKIIIPVLGGF